MLRPIIKVSTINCVILFATACAVAQGTGQTSSPAKSGSTGEENYLMRRRFGHPPLFFRENWQQVPKMNVQDHPLTQAWNPNLELKLYGPSGKDIVMNGISGDEFNFPHVWTGLCESTCALAFKHKDSYVDLSGLGKIVWLLKVSGFHQVHPILKLADGTWLVGDHGAGTIMDYQRFEVNLAEVHWFELDIKKVVTKGVLIEHPDLSKVDEIGFTTLMPGSGHGNGGYAGVGFMEVYGRPISRAAGTQNNK